MNIAIPRHGSTRSTNDNRKIKASCNLLFLVVVGFLFGIYVGITVSLNFKSDSSTNSILPFQTSISTNGEDSKENSEIRKQLKKSQDEIKRLQSITKNLNSKSEDDLVKIRELQNSCNTKFKNKTDVNFAKTNSHPICESIMPHPVPTALDLWNQHILKILSASRIPRDVKFMYHDFTTQLLQIMSPRLPRSVKTTPFDWRPVENALTVAWKRYQYLQLPTSQRDEIAAHDKPRPLKVLVMGGSLLVGTNCARMNREMKFEFGMPRRECNWSYRLGQFLNGFFISEDNPKERKIRTEQLFEVTKVAMGGTNTATGSVIWQYDLTPEEVRNPDIVINAYSTNDMHILTILEAQASNTTLRDKTFEMIQGFVRQVMGSQYCNSDGDEMIPPLLMHMDDYLGNEQRKIWETTEMSQGAQVLANYYGFVSMSYADVIREFVYGDTYETWFSSEWWVQDKTTKKKGSMVFDRQIHPGMGMHIASIWVTAYNLLQLASTYCSIPTDVVNHLKNNSISEYRAGLWGLPELDGRFKDPKGKPQSQPEGLPPELTKDLLLEDITSLWRDQSSTANRNRVQKSSCKLPKSDINGESSTATMKCPFSWVSGLSLQQNNITFIQEYFHAQSSFWEGWEISEDGDKIGFIPSKKAPNQENARMILDFTFSQKIHSVTLFFMKSYGTKWQNSELEARIWASPSSQQNSSIIAERHMLGTHNKNTSEMYTEEIILSRPIAAGEKLQLEAKLVGGETFKIMGLAVCS